MQAGPSALHGWLVQKCRNSIHHQLKVPIWQDALDAYEISRVEGTPRKLVVTLRGIAEAVIDISERSISLYAISDATTEETLEHFFQDQLLPGLCDCDGRLVVHGGGVLTNLGGLLLTGPSGRGKSTLTTALGLAGHLVQNDDCSILEPHAEGIEIRPTYSGIRLLPETLSALFPIDTPTTPVSHYATKRRVQRPDLLTERPAPLTAVLFLTGQDNDEVLLEPVAPSQACMQIIGLSMALDPTDLNRARERMRQAAGVVEKVPAFALSYPRDLQRLPEVCEAILRALKNYLVSVPEEFPI